MSSFDDTDAFEGASLSARAMAARPAPYLDGLNPAQRQAVETLDGPVLMLAGAGTGKTRALTARIAHLLARGQARPNEVLAVTFTNKAAREMKERVGRLMGHAVEGMPWMGTFHSISVKLLRRHAELVGLKSNFTILDTDDQIRLMKQIIAAANIDEKRWPARQLAGLIDNWKNRAWGPEQVPSSEASAFNNMGTELYAAYQARLLTLNACDFGDLLLHVVTIFQNHIDVLEQYQRWFRYIMVDEYQDTNVAQYLWLRLLAAKHKNICCVGDDDQSIYGWRGAEVGNILRFEKDFPGATVIRLEQNYRSTEHILAAASGLISANAGRLGKTLWTEAKGGEKVRLIGHWDGEEEARWIGEEAEAIQRGTRGMEPRSLNDQAILVRASHQMRAFEDRFLTIGLPYRVIGGPRFYERLEIRDAMAYFRLAVSPDDDLAFERVVNTPKRGLGDKAQQTIQRQAREDGVSLLEGARYCVASGQIGGKGGAQLRTFVENIDRWHRATLVPDYDHVRLAETILDESGYTAMWQNDKTPEAPGRLENLKELVKALENFDNLQGFLEHVSLIMDNDSEDAEEKITIMTLHAAKGLEFPVVFLPGWEDGLFPSQRSMDESGLKGLEEERRLGYVGITRAEELCTISFAGNRRVYGQWQSQMPSRFIDELPAKHVEVLTPPGLYGGGYGAAAMSAGIEDRAARADVYNSPGWKRMQTRSQTRPVSQPREARNVVIDLDAVSAFTEGDRVFHQKFGYGVVEGIEGDKLEVAFDKAGTKHVVASFIVSAEAADDIPF
ncbi:UvrD-helicase domain-containing protein [Defluviimonas sp. WL0050]|uniref:DNA 3'-5' helicase n=1 Tax=Albidovulum litorale TaxID=2984134 RepID=A0ABT2ZJZ6_9RHOB|nr:UvrD-helicase domain-containing protein [Defluviimonas sp. WL0050]MCV2871436.1 UvrD-helicase domain-containing protein [Defluviimonas sp. WL0050]